MPPRKDPSPLTADQPKRGADRNDNLANRADPATEKMLLPSLADGVTLLDVEGGRGVPILQSIVLDHLLMHEGPALWVDAEGHATTTTLSRLSPSRRILTQIYVARGFTAAQHFAAIYDLPNKVDEHIRESLGEAFQGPGAVGPPPESPADTRDNSDDVPESEAHCLPSLIVAPAVDAQYRRDDALSESQAATLQARTLARLRAFAEGYDVPVLLTRTAADDFAAAVGNAADHHLECHQTQMGPRFCGEDFETLLYPVDGGAYYQSTFAYWRQLLTARAEQVGTGQAPEGPSTPADGPIGTAPTMDGQSESLTASPLLDAWNERGRGR